MPTPHQDRHRSFAELNENEQAGRDYKITILPRPGSPVAVIAPQGGGIKRRASIVARNRRQRFQPILLALTTNSYRVGA